MKSFLLPIIFSLFFLLGPYCRAEGSDLTALYGKELLSAPSVARLKFQNECGINWYDATLKARTEFLTKWAESNQAAIKAAIYQNKKKAEEDKLKAIAEKARQDKINARQKIEADRLKALDKEKKDREKQIADMKMKREKALKDLKRLQDSRNRQHHSISQ